MCGLPPAVNDGRRVHERYEVGEGWEYPFRLSVSGTESGENAPRATSAGRELLTTPLNALPFIPLYDFHVSRGAMRVAGGFRAKGRHEAFRGAFMAGGWPPLSRRPIVFGCGKGLTKPRNLRTRPELQARPGGRLGRRSSVQGEGETSGLPRLVDASCTGKVRPAREVVRKRLQKGSATRSATGVGRSYRGVSATRIVHVEESVGLDRRRWKESKAGEPSYPADDGAEASSRGKRAFGNWGERWSRSEAASGNVESRYGRSVAWFAGAMRRRAVHSTLGDLTPPSRLGKVDLSRVESSHMHDSDRLWSQTQVQDMPLLCSSNGGRGRCELSSKEIVVQIIGEACTSNNYGRYNDAD
ncbi:hypothetical protein B0H14DRAFT_3143744 [Mycena olivaceomarginata]|nr:hypothetical protein B0H14DRAFT_3143744 [Mycena olivaceomarginata]